MAIDPHSLPLRERLRHAEKQVSELMTHLEQSYLKEVRHLQRITETDAPPVGDMSIRVSVAKVIQADEDTHKLWSQLRKSLQSVQADVERIVREG